MIVNIGIAEPGCLESAADACSLDLGKDLAYSNRRFEVSDLLQKRFSLGRPDRVARVRKRYAATMTRRPSEVSVFIVGDFYFLLWDDALDGFGINAFVGPGGERILSAYAAALTNFYLGIPTRRTVDGGILTLEYDVQQVKVTIQPNGETKIETSGFAGAACKTATEALEKALGGAVHEEEKPEMHQTAEEVATVNA